MNNEKVEADNAIFRLHNISSPEQLRRVGRATVARLREVEVARPKPKQAAGGCVFWLFVTGALSLAVCGSLTYLVVSFFRG
ncbi:MAG: hypothetical protein KC418_24110 [Anaerolineales bacterium]|nr:hypothetical protein [Anaerolineales bacterium]